MEKVRVTKVNVVKDEKSASKKAKGRAKRRKGVVDESVEKVEVTKVTLDAPVAKEIRNEVIDKADADNDNFVDSENTFNKSSVNSQIGVPKKVKKIRKHKPVGKAGFIAICTSMSILGAGAGCAGGYFLYQKFKPEQKFESSFCDYLEVRETAKANPDLTKAFEGREYDILNCAFDKYQSHKNTLTLGYGIVGSMNGDQTVHAVTIGGENKAFNQNVSSTGADAIATVNTAYRFYYDLNDKTNPKITGYEKKFPADWKADMTPDNEYTADQFTEKYGKLNYGNYIVDDSNKFVTLGDQGEGNIINGVSIYQFTSKSCSKWSKLTTNEAGNYVMEVTLKSSKACGYYANQIKTNGGLSAKPHFKPSLKITFELNQDYELVSSYVEEEYEITMGLAVKCNATMLQKYFYSDDESLVVEGKNIVIPEKGSQFPLKLDAKGTVIAN